MTQNLKSTTNELWNGWKLAWYNNFTHIGCAKKLRGLREKLDALRVQTGQSLSMYTVLDENSSITKGFHFLTYFNSIHFMHSICTIESHIINFQPFSDFICYFHAFHDLFWAKMTVKLKSTANELWNGWKLAWCHNFTHVACVKKLRWLREKLDALRVQTWQSPSKHQGFGQKLVYYKGISIF